LIVALPLYELTLSLSGILAMTVALLLATVLLTAVVPAMFSSLHLVCGSTRRALAVAIALFFANLIGLGFGPLIAGALSDRFGITYGPGDGLRYALMFVIPALLPAGLLMLRAAKYLRSDAED
jgi:MFS family permease